jgi:hypothetical protein
VSKCNIAVTVDGWEAMGDVAPTFRTGDPITGTVHVWVNEKVRCDGLDVELVPIRTTQGYYLGLDLPRTRVFEGEWEPGEHDVRFSVPSHWLPSYEGTLGWKWVARATADIPWASDPKGESEFVAEWSTPPVGVEIEPLSDDEAVAKRSPLKGPMLGLSFVGLAMIPGGLVAKYFELADADLLGGVAGLGVLIGMICYPVYRSLASGRPAAGSATVVLKQREGGGGYRAEGGSFLDCEAKPKADIGSMIARLVVEEYAEWTTRRNDHTTTHRRHHLHHKRDVEMTRGEDGAWRASIPLPAPDAVPCFSIGNPPGHGIVWKVELLSLRPGEDEHDVTRRDLVVRPRFA